MPSNSALSPTSAYGGLKSVFSNHKGVITQGFNNSNTTENSTMQRCKKGGVVNADKISQLPEDLILHILCLLPTRLAITTSVLSKQWQSHWKMMPNLKIEYCNLQYLDIENVCKSLLSHKAPVLQSFHLHAYTTGNNAADPGILIGIALTRNVRELVLKVLFHKGSLKVPRSLYNCETLKTLKLMYDVIMDVPSSVNLKSLRTLHLNCVDFKDDESFVKLLSGCPNLEDLKVRKPFHSSVKTFTIAVPSLQRLSINNGNGDGGLEKGGYVINTPSLKYLEIRWFVDFVSFVIENVPVPALVEADITDRCRTVINEKLMVSLTSVKRLSLDLSLLKYRFPNGMKFHHLVYLELYTFKNAWWNLLTLMLDTSPKLQVLKLLDVFGWDNNLASSREWNQPKNVPECFLCHLEIFMWEGYKWRREEEREVAKYILKNTKRLKRATFSSKWMSSEDRLEVVKDLKSHLVRATNSCHFQFK